ncbi:glutaminase [Microbacterium sp. MYb54]|nr:glutaminase [Microbacterium sp. MYb43]PQZ75137.1 glutaminase [Microbacterium sp. MYb40]PRB19432.1 glutaminase [Microbacterium sp. MYb54]PRB24633.1 glutaminase [Microbacterium sp. MYb50]PRB63744.1 glutaminase [Microbacterium sp. MYb24]PRB66134.1 glutaminase [Microbacterium sp. MYb32]
MQTPMIDYLHFLLDSVGTDAGAVASYIPELAHADPDKLAVAVASPDGVVYVAGDADAEFTIQSISKPFAYALAIADQGLDVVLEHIDVEPSGDAFNEISLDPETGRPRNPMINAGAIASHALVRGEDADARVGRILDLCSRLAGRQLSIAEDVFESELSTADRNMALAYMLRTVGTLHGEPTDIVRGYTRQCSVSVTVRDLARMASVLAAGGRTPDGDQAIAPAINRQVLSVMATCGMYDSAGDWLTSVGIPAKSGVAGGLMGVLPGQVGIAVFSPRLDPHGNSTRGVRMFERMNRDLGLHLMDSTDSTRSVARRWEREGVAVHEVMGDLHFVEAERVLRGFAQDPAGDAPVVVDLDRVHRTNDIARRMLLEGIRRLHLDGHEVRIVDPWGVLGSAETGSGELVRGEPARGGYVPTAFPDIVSALRG